MKRIIIKYTLFTAVLLLTACKGFLDKDPIATLDAGSFFQTEADAIQAINAAYKPLTFSTGLLVSWRVMKPLQEAMVQGQGLLKLML
jgi:hypothetical protein